MATKISRKLKKAEKKRDAILHRDEARRQRRLDGRAAKGARPASATRAAVAKRAAGPAPTRSSAFSDTDTVAVLREAAKASEVAGYSRMTKSQLLEALA